MIVGDRIAEIWKFCAVACVVGLAGNAEAAGNGIPETVDIPSGWFWQGSDSIERQYAYQIDEQVYGHDISRRNRWYDLEADKWRVHLLGYDIGKTPVTNDQYAVFVEETGHLAPTISQEDWERQGLIYNYDTIVPFLWNDGRPRAGVAIIRSFWCRGRMPTPIPAG